MDKVLLAVDPKELWKFALDEDGYRKGVELVEIEEKYLNELQEKQLAIIEHYGLEEQLNRLIEECGELVQAICKWKRYPDTNKLLALIEELADVKNLIEQVELDSDYIEDGITRIKEYKINRELDRIKE